ncbi:hypothetical protein [Litoreibacter ponti]|uniref:hypothetical protein n=1 Tax=Litoreibacter ponti TaxID=1510457 RepID=UPI001304B4D5|nr:hypothetical protein [Litoreibacter ponti]
MILPVRQVQFEKKEMRRAAGLRPAKTVIPSPDRCHFGKMVSDTPVELTIH